jgi:hypothetical protein
MSLQSQFQLIEQAWRAGQHALLPSLQDLFVQSHTDKALAWSDLAWLRLRLPVQEGDSLRAEQEAFSMLERAYAIRADCWQALDGLCEVQHRLGDDVQARQWGRAALSTKHALALSKSDAQQSATAQRYANVQSELQVVAFSLFGREPFYAEAAVRNAHDVATWYPGWICRFYVGSDVCADVKRRLREAGAEVMPPPKAQAHLPGTVWRFMALDDLRVKTALLRDADSLITEREVFAVQQWLASDCQAHVMRDHVLHTELMLAGLWGAHARSLRGIGDAMLDFFKHPFHPTHADQHFLRDWVWPRIWRSVKQHDSALNWHAPEAMSSQDYSRSLASGEDHIGHAPTQWRTLNAGGFNSSPLHFQIEDAQGRLLGQYIAQNGEHGYSLRFPPHVLQALDTGQWRISARTHAGAPTA